MNPAGIEILGWSATAIFVASYFCSRPALLRAVQMFGALLWVSYGLLIKSSPVIVANLLVFLGGSMDAVPTSYQSAHVRSSARVGRGAHR